MLFRSVSDMLVRKLYGCLTVDDFHPGNFQGEQTKREELITEQKEVRKRYQKLVG